MTVLAEPNNYKYDLQVLFCYEANLIQKESNVREQSHDDHEDHLSIN